MGGAQIKETFTPNNLSLSLGINRHFMEALIFILFALVVYILVKQQTLKSRLDQLMDHYFKLAGDRDALQQKVETLREQLEALQGKTIIAEPEPAATSPEIIEPEVIISEEIIPEPTVASLSVTESLATESPVVAIEKEDEEMAVEAVAFSAPKVEEAQTRPVSYTPPTPPEPSAFSLLLKKWERQFADNWTGILGTAIMVLGVGYLSIYTALKVSPLYRVLIIWAYAGLLMSSFLFLKTKPLWQKTGLWLRSAGASLFLFGCFGATQLPALQFIAQPIPGYGLLLLGIILNLYIGYRIKQQTFLSLHVVLSLLILCVVPQKMLLTFLIASGTAAAGILLSYKEKWEYHLMSVIGSFLIFDIWFTAEETALSHFENKMAILGIVLVSICCMLMQYRKWYDRTTFDKAGFSTHLVNWGLFAIGLLLHATGSKFKTVVLLLGAIVCFWIASQAKRRGIKWLYQIDFLVAFILGSLMIVTLNEWEVRTDILVLALYLFCNSVVWFTYKTDEKITHTIVKYALFGLGICIVFMALAALADAEMLASNKQFIFTFSALAFVALGIHLFTQQKKEFSDFDTLPGFSTLHFNGLFTQIVQLLTVSLVYHQYSQNSFLLALVIPAIVWSGLIFLKDSVSIQIGRLLFVVLAFIECGYVFANCYPTTTSLVLCFGLFVVTYLNWKKPEHFGNRFVLRLISSLGSIVLTSIIAMQMGKAYPLGVVILLVGIAIGLQLFMWHLTRREFPEADLPRAFKIIYYGLGLTALVYMIIRCDDLSTYPLLIGCIILTSSLFFGLWWSDLQSKIQNCTDALLTQSGVESGILFLVFEAAGILLLSDHLLLVYQCCLPLLYFTLSNRISFLQPLSINAFIVLVLGYLQLFFTTNSEQSSIELLAVLGSFGATLLYSISMYFSSKPDGKKLLSPTIYLNYSVFIFLVHTLTDPIYSPLAFSAAAIIHIFIYKNNRTPLFPWITELFTGIALLYSLTFAYSNPHSFTWINWITQIAAIALAIFGIVLRKATDSNLLLKWIQQLGINAWLSLLVYSQLAPKWMPFYWTMMAILQLFLYQRKQVVHRGVPIFYYLIGNLHLGILGFWYYESGYWPFYVALMGVMGFFIALAYRILEDFKLKNSLLIYPTTLSIGLFLYLTFDKGVLTFLWVLEALGLLVLSITLKEKYFRFVSLGVVGLCIIRLMFFDLSNADFLIRALVLLGVGVVLLVMNSLFKRYKDRFD